MNNDKIPPPDQHPPRGNRDDSDDATPPNQITSVWVDPDDPFDAATAATSAKVSSWTRKLYI